MQNSTVSRLIGHFEDFFLNQAIMKYVKHCPVEGNKIINKSRSTSGPLLIALS